jgi:adenine-specific DNA-methyltransferase
MLNVIATNQRPTEMSAVSGIPVGWNKSEYNKKGGAVDAMKQLLEDGLKVAHYVLLSYNNEGIITEEEWETLFHPYEVKKYEIRYDTYKGSRNLKNRAPKVMERMYLISKK